MTRGRPTRADVARVAGTSVAVVSYVVNNGPRPVADSTRQRVLNAIKETNYRPDGIARALASGSTRTFGLIVPNVANPFVASLSHAIEDQAFKRGFSLLLGDSADDRLREAELVNTFLQHQIDGLIFYGVDRDHPWLDEATSKIPVVVLDEPESTGGGVCVRVDERAASAAATRHLIDHGCRTIATIAGPVNQENSRDRISGWRQALTESGMLAQPDLVFEAPYTQRGGYSAAQEIFRRTDLPEAIFVANEQQALGFLSAAHENRISIPDDIAIICFNGTSNAEYSIPALSTVEQPTNEIAEHAIALLSTDLPTDQRTVLCDFRLVPRRSCGCTYNRALPAEPELTYSGGSS